MSQQEILEVLQKSKKPMTSDEMSKKLGKNRSSINAATVKLFRVGDIEKVNRRKYIKNFDGRSKPYLWKIKRK